MFNKDSLIDNPTALSYIPGDKGMFNAWWMKETIEFPSFASRLERGDAILLDGIRWFVSGYTNEDDLILVNDTVAPTATRVLQNGSTPVTCSEERSNIARHGRRLGYTGSEEVW